MPDWLLKVFDWHIKGRSREVWLDLDSIHDTIYIIKEAAESGATKFQLTKKEEKDDEQK